LLAGRDASRRRSARRRRPAHPCGCAGAMHSRGRVSSTSDPATKEGNRRQQQRRVPRSGGKLHPKLISLQASSPALRRLTVAFSPSRSRTPACMPLFSAEAPWTRNVRVALEARRNGHAQHLLTLKRARNHAFFVAYNSSIWLYFECPIKNYQIVNAKMYLY
jgi:hypothetical protein